MFKLERNTVLSETIYIFGSGYHDKCVKKNYKQEVEEKVGSRTYTIWYSIKLHFYVVTQAFVT